MTDKDKLQNYVPFEILTAQQLKDERLEKEYHVYVATDEQYTYVVKQVNANEYKMNQLLKEYHCLVAPESVYYTQDEKGHGWLTARYFDAEDLTTLATDALLPFVEKLLLLVTTFNEHQACLNDVLPTASQQLEGKTRLLSKLVMPSFYHNYQNYLTRLVEMPQTLVHDDLLPINVLFDKERKEVAIVDWEHGRRGSYVTDLARFMAFYSDDKELFTKGITFLDTSASHKQLASLFYSKLPLAFKQVISKDLFLYDLHLELLQQYLANIAYLEQISEEYLTNEWERYAFKMAQTEVALLSDLSKKLQKK